MGYLDTPYKDTSMNFLRIFSIGLAIFAMLFGAGNVVFPLGLGRDVGSNVLFAVAGLALTGILVPVLGLISAALFEGDYKKFLGMMGEIPGALIAMICMLLIGPFGATPRCVTLAYAAIKWHVPNLSLFAFTFIVSCIIFLATIKRRHVVALLGRFLGPIKLFLLLTIVVLGFIAVSTPPISSFSPSESFFKGIREGYWTLDLLATIFFSGLVIASIKAYSEKKEQLSAKKIMYIGLSSGVIGGLLLGLVYTGFCILAAKYSVSVVAIPKEQLLSALATLVLGHYGSMLANAVVAVACLTTAIALTAVFADYLTHEIFLGRINYRYALLLTVTAVFAMANLNFAGIAHVVEPFAILCYPALIALSIANIAYVLWGFRYTKPVVYLTLAITIINHFWR